MVLRVPNVLLGPMFLGIFACLGVTLDAAETPLAKTPFSWFLSKGIAERKIAVRFRPPPLLTTVQKSWVGLPRDVIVSHQTQSTKIARSAERAENSRFTTCRKWISQTQKLETSLPGALHRELRGFMRILTTFFGNPQNSIMIRVFRPFVLIMTDFCGFFQGKSSEFAWIPEVPYTMHPVKKSSKKSYTECEKINWFTRLLVQCRLCRNNSDTGALIQTLRLHHWVGNILQLSGYLGRSTSIIRTTFQPSVSPTVHSAMNSGRWF